MIEIMLVLGSLAALTVLATITTVVTPHLMTEIGLWALLAGLAAGLPTGIWYHVALYRALHGRVPIPGRWWLSPTDLHVHLRRDELHDVRRWFVIGGAGFALSLTGGLAAMIGMLMAH